jgi:hypothetical protein
MKSFLLFVLSLLVAWPAWAHELRLEGGAYQTISNRFNIPNPGGSRVLVSNSSLELYGRGQVNFRISESGSLRLLVAPLGADYAYLPTGQLIYHGSTFPAGVPVSVEYRFNSYRLGYVHRVLRSDAFQLWLGGVAKARHARITVSGSGQSAGYRDFGFVPLLNLSFSWKFWAPLELRFDIDGAAASQGRAFDGALELFMPYQEAGSGLSAGVRVLEGGAENEKVNTFALFHYAFLALTVGF